MLHRIGAAAVLALGTLALTGGIAAADPEPADPAVPPPVEVLPPPDPFTVASEQSKADPAGTLSDLVGGGPSGSPVDVLAQNFGFTAPPPFNPLDAVSQLRPENYRMPAADQDSPYPLAPNSAPSPFARVDAWKGVHALAHAGLGRMPGGDLGSPLPGTAPPPGTNLPPGLEQFYIDPALPPDPAAPPA
jgi:hypothetical protein